MVRSSRVVGKGQMKGKNVTVDVSLSPPSLSLSFDLVLHPLQVELLVLLSMLQITPL